MENSIFIGKDFGINISKLNRHGLISGSTGSGKTVTLQVIVEQLSKNGVPVFVSDIKGELSGLLRAGELNENIKKRLGMIGVDDFETRNFPVEFFDIYGEQGIPLRTTISEMGPVLLAKLLGLNEVQEDILNIAFDLSDTRGLELIDIKDLRAVLNFINDNKKELSEHYGNISTSSVGAILRSLLAIEKQGGNLFFGEPAFDIKDFIRINENGEGIINILSAKKLHINQELYATFLLWLLSELYENLEEIGDSDKPKLVFFFDEAHILFKNESKILLEKIETIVRMIRSKGIGIFFITQKVNDIPDNILSQIGNRIQHAVRAYTPKEQKELKAIAESFRQEDDTDLVEEIKNLKTGEAIISVLDTDSKPTVAKKITILPPQSNIGQIDELSIMKNINNSTLYDKYSEYIDNISAYEKLEEEKLEKAKMLEEEAVKEALAKQEEIEQKEILKEQKRKSNKTSLFERFANNIVGSIGRAIGREITRGIFGTKNRR